MELRLLLKCVHDRGHDKEEGVREGVWMGRLRGALA